MLPTELLPNIAIFLLSLAVLAKASHSAIKASINLAKHLEIGEFAVGFVIIAIATSLPELWVSIMAGLSGRGEVIIGHVIGSNVANKLLVFGLVAFFQGVLIKQKEFIRHAEILLGISILPIIFLWIGEIGVFSGLALIGIFLVYVIIIPKTKINLGIKTILPHSINAVQEAYNTLKGYLSAFVEMGILLLAIAFIIVSSYVVVESVHNMVESLETDLPAMHLISITILALGTSLPEIAIAVTAIREKHKSLAIGEVLGTSIVNLTLVLGIGGLFTPIPVAFATIGPAIIFMLLINGIILYFMTTKKKLGKLAGLLFLFGYIIFIITQIALFRYA
ncbi:hypothetical protein K8R43_06210 [archaeon]|nr:hypothetical protein [archaeon]